MDVTIRVFELGGFGDVVAAVKMGEALSEQEHTVTYQLHDLKVKHKFDTLFPGLKSAFTYNNETHGELTIAVIGNGYNTCNDVFVGEFDYLESSPNRPVTIMPGLSDYYAYVDTPFNRRAQHSAVKEFSLLTPMFYAPYRLDALPKPGEENIREVIIENVWSMKSDKARDMLYKSERIGVCYAAMPESIVKFANQLRIASNGFARKRLGVAVLSDANTEKKVKEQLLEKGGYAIIGSDAKIEGDANSKVLVAMLGTKPQTVTTSLFFSSEMPNLVTGDGSLSDAIYALTFLNGQGFFYEPNPWKSQTTEGITKLMSRQSENAERSFSQAAKFLQRYSYGKIDRNPIASVLSSERNMDSYTKGQRDSFLKAFRSAHSEGVTPEAVTVQGTIGRVVEELAAKPALLSALRNPPKHEYVTPLWALRRTQIKKIAIS